MASHREALKAAAVVMTCGKLVAAGNSPPKVVPGPTLETPCKASDHHWYALIPSRGTAPALLTSSFTFSSNVNLPIRSLTLSATANDRRQNG